MINKYIKISNPMIYYNNIYLLGKLFRQYGGNPMYYISEYKVKIRELSNKDFIIEEEMFSNTENLKELLKQLDNLIKENEC